jgi:hypothetical protein
LYLRLLKGSEGCQSHIHFVMVGKAYDLKSFAGLQDCRTARHMRGLEGENGGMGEEGTLNPESEKLIPSNHIRSV